MVHDPSDRLGDVYKTLSVGELIQLLQRVNPELRVWPNQVHNLALFVPSATLGPDYYAGAIEFGEPAVEMDDIPFKWYVPDE